jgi:hypothetical protein
MREKPEIPQPGSSFDGCEDGELGPVAFILIGLILVIYGVVQLWQEVARCIISL